jgi:hypothetical protein
MKRKLAYLALLTVVASATSVVAATTTATAAPPRPAATVNISAADTGGVLSGVFDITNFVVNSAGQLVAQGVFTGTATINGVAQEITSTASVILSTAQATGPCTILTLDLGPLHLDLLGLNVDLSAVTLDITAQPGAGKLLGNLLCTVSGLLDNNNVPGAIQQLLNLINQLLGGV